MADKKKIPVTHIDSTVPVPVRTNISYPLKVLDVGESFLFPLSKRGSLQSRVSRVKAETGREFTVKKVDSLNGRVWRVK